MASLIVYGSLMAKSEIASFGVNVTLATPIMVHGFKRAFAQEPSWRMGVGEKRAVLTVVRSPLHSFNGILLSQIEDSAFIQLDAREKGYNREFISPILIRPFGNGNVKLGEESPYLYVGKPEQYNDALQPNPDYLVRCLKASQEWGEAFYQIFYHSTLGLASIPT